MPVDGPPRCTLMMVAGISAKYARPMNSVISDTPGPDVAVNARAPFQPAPTTMPIEAISSSACTIANRCWPVAASTRYFEQYFWNASAHDDDGVIGYHAHTVAPPYTAPSAAALLPSTKIFLPTLSARFTVRPIGHFRCSLAKSRPRCSACTFDDSSFSLPLYCSPKSFSITAASISSSTDSAPTYTMFLNSWRWRASE